MREQIKRMLPFKPTGAQKKVLVEIARDMESPAPMNRLLQGDVGSGKTLVAAEAAIIALENGWQVATLAPTEILATQHFFYFKDLFRKLGYTVALLTGSNTKGEKTQFKRALAAGLVQFAVGTHALIEEDVEFQKLGLAIVDEQHRFGVMQRLRLIQKGPHPDVLVLTATPIPRTLALTLYGDLDVSVIDELPPGRKPIVTRHSAEDAIEQVWSFVKREIEQGRQAYVVYPVIEESETQAMKAAEKMYQHLAVEVFPQLRIGLMHGRLTHGREGIRHGAVQGRRDAGAGLDYGDRGGHRRAERDGDGDRAGGALRPLAVAPAPRARGAGRQPELLHSGDRQAERHRPPAHPHAGGFERRLPHRGDGFEAARAGRVLRDQAIRACRRCGSPIFCAIPKSSRLRGGRLRRWWRGRRRTRIAAGRWCI